MDLLKVDEALDLALSKIRSIDDIETVRVVESFSRVLAEDLIAPVDIPQSDISAVDGFALMSSDTIGASSTNPIELRIIDEDSIGPGECRKIFTGEPLPRGANAVIMLEDVEILEDKLIVRKPVGAWENVTRRGSSVRKGERIMERGEVVGFGELGLLLQLGLREIKALRKPRVAILNVGDELIEPEEYSPGRGEVNVSGYLLRSLLRFLGCDVRYLGIARDRKEEIIEKLKEGLRSSDLILTTGGCSFSEKDVLSSVLSELGDVVFRGIAAKPGKPTMFTLVDDKPVLSLPGFPLTTMVIAMKFLPPIVQKLGGRPIQPVFPEIRCLLARDIPSTYGLREFVRVRISRRNGELIADPLPYRGASILRSLKEADGIMEIPEDVEFLEKGTEISVKLIDPGVWIEETP